MKDGVRENVLVEIAMGLLAGAIYLGIVLLLLGYMA